MVTETEKRENTTIQISVENRDKLIKYGSMQEDYNDVLTRILKFYETARIQQ
jgi:hypothetical protein